MSFSLDEIVYVAKAVITNRCNCLKIAEIVVDAISF